MKDTRLPKCVMFGELVGEKIDGVEMAQDGGTRGGTFHGKMNRWRKKQGGTTACSSMSDRDGKDKEEDSPKQSCSSWFVHRRVNKPKVVKTCILRAFLFADTILPFSGNRFLSLFCFVLFSSSCFLHRIRGPSFNRSSIRMRPDSNTQLVKAVLYTIVPQSPFFSFCTPKYCRLQKCG